MADITYPETGIEPHYEDARQKIMRSSYIAELCAGVAAVICIPIAESARLGLAVHSGTLGHVLQLTVLGAAVPTAAFYFGAVMMVAALYCSYRYHTARNSSISSPYAPVSRLSRRLNQQGYFVS